MYSYLTDEFLDENAENLTFCSGQDFDFYGMRFKIYADTVEMKLTTRYNHEKICCNIRIPYDYVKRNGPQDTNMISVLKVDEFKFKIRHGIHLLYEKYREKENEFFKNNNILIRW